MQQVLSCCTVKKTMTLQDMILKGFDNECRKFIKNIYEEAGVTIHLFSSPKKLEKGSNGKMTLTIETKDGKEETLADVDQVLFATGRKPNTKDLGLESADVELDEKGGVKVSHHKALPGSRGIFGSSLVLPFTSSERDDCERAVTSRSVNQNIRQGTVNVFRYRGLCWS